MGIKWAAVAIPDIRSYQLQHATNANFLSPTTVTLYSTHYTLPDASPETTYYVRVRALNSTGDSGNWSSTLNSETGQASVSNLADGSASNIIVKTKTAGFTPATVDGAGTNIGRYLNLSINFPVAAETLLIGLAKGVLSLNDTESMFVRLKVDGTTKIEYEQSPNGIGINTTGTFTVPGLSIPVLIPSGAHEFLLEIECTGTSTYQPTETSLVVWQVRK
jgi:hypothetical protein